MTMTDAPGAAPVAAASPSPATPKTYTFEFRGKGSEYFGIWIVNLVLTILTLGIYGAWAKVRTQRYFYGNTYIGDSALDYHASPIRILIGRAIAVTLLISYYICGAISPMLAGAWGLLFLIAFPWLVNSAIRFNARNTSYRNVRFNFTATYWDAVKAYVLWPIAGFMTLFLLIPPAHRARDYFFINNHSFGGRYFETKIPLSRMYGIYLLGLLLFVGFMAAAGFVFAAGVGSLAHLQDLAKHPPKTPPAGLVSVLFAAFLLIEFGLITVATFVSTMIFNISISRTKLDDRHALEARLSAWWIVWIYISNTFLLLITLGLFYPWARVRLRRYQTSRLTLLAASDLNEFTSEVFKTQGAIGEEVALFFDLNIGL
jgi:uncharacterized membrane protein YjgN (DUF898 family)